MGETDWLTSGNPRAMLDHARTTAGQRKLRWFACGCVRHVWGLLLDASSQRAVEVAERFADGDATSAELVAAEAAAFDVARLADLRNTVSDPGWAATRAAARAANLDAYSAATGASFTAALAAAPWRFLKDGKVDSHGDLAAKQAALRRQADLLREVVGNPFRPVAFDPAWLAWNHGAAGHLARSIYADNTFSELPILADSLEEAGCTAAALLEHLWSPGPHGRGCWALDVVLGRT